MGFFRILQNFRRESKFTVDVNMWRVVARDVHKTDSKVIFQILKKINTHFDFYCKLPPHQEEGILKSVCYWRTYNTGVRFLK